MLLAAGFFAPVLVTYIKCGLVPQFPTLIICGFAAIASFQSFFAGLILSTIYEKNRQDFEMNLYKVMHDEIRLQEQKKIDYEAGLE